jgi:hypothetical protein
MALTYTGTGGLFTRLGKMILEQNRVVSGYGTLLNSGMESIWDQFPNSDQDAIAIDGLLLARDGYRTVHGSYISSLVTAEKNTIIEQVNRQGATLSNKTLVNALTELDTQMRADAASLNRPTTTATVTAGGSNTGNGVVAVSLTNKYGEPLDMVFAETVKFKVTSDAGTGATAFSEVLTVTGEPALPNTDYRWPGGSGTSKILTMQDASNTTLVTDGGFETWSGSTPTYWTATTGSATVDKDSTAANVIRGTYAMKFTSDGSTLTTVRQQLSTSITTNTVYNLNLWAKVSSADASGVVRFRLTNSAGTTLTNDATTSLSYTRDTNGQIGTSFTQVNTFFQTPRALPTTGGVWLEIAFTTAPANGVILYLDHLSFIAATQLYNGGPYVAAFSRSTANAVRDTYSLAVTNTLTYTSLVRSLDRWIGLRDNNIALPTSGSPTIADSLIG